MRVTNNTFSDNLIANLQQLTGRMNTLQGQTATGQRISTPSEDPGAASRVLGYQSDRSRIVQYYSNAKRAGDVIDSTLAQVRNFLSVSERANEIVSLSSDIAGPDALNAYGNEIDALLEQALSNANTNFNGEPLFGGTGNTDTPFVATRDANGRITSVAYAGSANAAKFEISDGSTLSPYADNTANQGVLAFLNNLVSLRDALATGSDANVKAQSANMLASEDDLVSTLSGMGALQGRIEVEVAQNSTRYSQLASQISREVDVDIAQSVVELTQTQNAYQAALMSAGKVLNKSLLDYV